MKTLKILLYLLAAAAGVFILFLLYSTLDDYQPEKQEAVYRSDQPGVFTDSVQLSMLIWNIGYCGLDRSMDFFYDGGKQMRPSEEGVNNNLKGVLETLMPYRSYDFVLIQELDRKSKRSYRINMQEVIGASFPEHHHFFGKNYDVTFVPIPLKEPMGKVESGLLTLSRANPASVVRYSFPGNYAWPVKLFMLDRCFLVNRYPVVTSRIGPGSSGTTPQENKELVVINTHNSAYDDGSLRKQQMEYLKQFLLDEYGKGNYVIVGGDWNQTPYGLKPELPGHLFDTINLTYVEKDYPDPGWPWAFDPGKPTNRRVNTPYDRGTTLTTVIDYYLLSPNIEVKHIQTVDVGFTYSDHQPVELGIGLIPAK
ncbi:MAG: endonuclease/exonuclease/phosphatase family protein [Bacteroidales bacterium]|nr:endonuclease/exonuclease/phosphatase family protein [Bacteroidales bacterium]MBN2699536.1 endonuclease/exonuclease/phosphatase family protein [Bacteroidales bacterium]